jgi:hypothetical protein
MIHSLKIFSKKIVCSHISMHDICHVHPILFDLITLIIFSEHYKLLSSLLCSFLNSPVTSPIPFVQMFSSAPFSHTLFMFVLLQGEELSQISEIKLKICNICVRLEFSFQK